MRERERVHDRKKKQKRKEGRLSELMMHGKYSGGGKWNGRVVMARSWSKKEK